MPIKNSCLLCNGILISSEEKKYGSHYHCLEGMKQTSHYIITSELTLENTLKSNLALILYNSIAF